MTSPIPNPLPFTSGSLATSWWILWWCSQKKQWSFWPAVRKVWLISLMRIWNRSDHRVHITMITLITLINLSSHLTSRYSAAILQSLADPSQPYELIIRVKDKSDMHKKDFAEMIKTLQTSRKGVWNNLFQPSNSRPSIIYPSIHHSRQNTVTAFFPNFNTIHNPHTTSATENIWNIWQGGILWNICAWVI